MRIFDRNNKPSLKTSMFSKQCKTRCSDPLDKGSLDKNDVNSSRPVSVLNCFVFLFFENVKKGQLLSFIENHLSVFLSACRSCYSSQHVLVRLIEEWRQKLDINHYISAVLMEISKAFHCIPHDLLTAKLSAYIALVMRP